jgi:hypothetical protein
MIPILNLTMFDGIVKTVCSIVSSILVQRDGAYLELATASSPIKKSRSSIPLLLAKWPGLPATGGGALPPPDPDPEDA